MKYILEIIYNITDKNCPVYDVAFEYADYTFISLEGDFVSDCACNQDAMELMQEHLSTCKDLKELSYDKTYKTVFSVEVSYSTDYWGEVDSDYTYEELYHGEYSQVRDTPDFDIGSLL